MGNPKLESEKLISFLAMGAGKHISFPHREDWFLSDAKSHVFLKKELDSLEAKNKCAELRDYYNLGLNDPSIGVYPGHNMKMKVYIRKAFLEEQYQKATSAYHPIPLSIQ